MGNTPIQKNLCLKNTQNSNFEVDVIVYENIQLLLVIFYEWLHVVSPLLN